MLHKTRLKSSKETSFKFARQTELKFSGNKYFSLETVNTEHFGDNSLEKPLVNVCEKECLNIS